MTLSKMMAYHKNGIFSRGTLVVNPIDACGAFLFS